MNIATLAPDIAQDIIAKSRSTPPAPAPVQYRLTTAHIDASLPPEYRGAMAKRALIDATEDHHTILISGPPGTGKTRQLWGIVRWWRMSEAKRIGVRSVPYDLDVRRKWAVPGIDTWAEGVCKSMEQRQPIVIMSESSDIRANRFDRDWLASVCADRRWLAIDDIGCVRPDQWVQEAVYEIATQRRKNQYGTIWTTNLSGDELREQYGAAIASRLMGGKVFELDGNDRRTT